MDSTYYFPWPKRNTRPGPPRFWEVDYCRGIAVFMMILFHTVFDLAYFGVFPIDVNSGPWKLLAICTASLFLLLVGVSLTLSGARAYRVMDKRSFLVKYLRRGGGIMVLGLLITLVTLVMAPGEPILFGILHLIGLSVMLSPLFLRRPWECLAAAMVIIPLGWIISGIPGPLWLAWLGVHPQHFASLDYTPLLPWIGVVFIGVFLGHLLYPDGERRYQMPENPVPGKKAISLIGRHSLAIYVLHQPVLLLMISILFSISVLPAGL